eukprot:CAMPEP_0182469874 /NCGR_PEP_ID=MMETSP1319-20130603/17766_1 /TAXON_ID=172717 /ORGANISM="Bolidomonas pacifica, Strain RCC208" /LENGTH=308 /DNA_ID=CAMNT_0024670235 /DNA_START=98 /DNA_END=1021 /DNA_ORIENTATION=+
MYKYRAEVDRFVISNIVPLLLSFGGRAVRLLEVCYDKLLLHDAEGGENRRCFRWRSEPKPRSYNFAAKYLPSPKRTKKKKKRMLAPPRSLSQEDTIYLSFSGCSWCVFYHLGVAECFLESYPPERYSYVCAGASSGSLIAYALCDGVDISKVKDFCFTLLHAISDTDNRMRPWGRMSEMVETGLRRFMEEGAARRCEGKLHVSCSLFPSLLKPHLECKVVSSFEGSDEKLINALLSSCYIPLYYEKATKIDGVLSLDGGLTNNQPLLPGAVTVSPFGPADITNKRAPYPPLSSVFPGAIEDCQHMLEH